MDKAIFPYTQKDMDYLSARDPLLGGVINAVGPIQRAVMPDLFEALVNSIVGQQISTKAQITVWNRLLERVESVTPDALLDAGSEALRSCGLSGRKSGYILSAASAVKNGDIDLKAMRTLPDSAVISALTKLPGVGVWTAEMLLLFSLCRKNVFSTRDFGIRRGVSIVYRTEATEELMQELYSRYAPLASVASLYLWEASSRGMNVQPNGQV